MASKSTASTSAAATTASTTVLPASHMRAGTSPNPTQSRAASAQHPTGTYTEGLHVRERKERAKTMSKATRGNAADTRSKEGNARSAANVRTETFAASEPPSEPRRLVTAALAESRRSDNDHNDGPRNTETSAAADASSGPPPPPPPLPRRPTRTPSERLVTKISASLSRSDYSASLALSQQRQPHQVGNTSSTSQRQKQRRTVAQLELAPSGGEADPKGRGRLAASKGPNSDKRNDRGTAGRKPRNKVGGTLRDGHGSNERGGRGSSAAGEDPTAGSPPLQEPTTQREVSQPGAHAVRGPGGATADRNGDITRIDAGRRAPPSVPQSSYDIAAEAYLVDEEGGGQRDRGEKVSPRGGREDPTRGGPSIPLAVATRDRFGVNFRSRGVLIAIAVVVVSVVALAVGLGLSLSGNSGDGSGGNAEQQQQQEQQQEQQPPPAASPPPTPSTEWERIGSYLDSPDSTRDYYQDTDMFGFSISLSSDGSRVAVGATRHGGARDVSGYEPDGYLMDRGLVRVYQLTGSSSSGNFGWNKVGKDLLGEKIEDYFGRAVALSGDGMRLAVGVTGYDEAGVGFRAGMVEVLEYSTVIESWEVLARPIVGEAAGDQCGRSVALSHDGAVLAVGCHKHADDRGHVRLYKFNPSATTAPGGDWVQLGTAIEGDEAGDYMGQSVSLSSDGAVIAVGADGNGAGVGTVKVYAYDGNVGDWVQMGLGLDGTYADEGFGWAVSLSPHGDVVAVGAMGLYSTTGGRASVYRYDADLDQWGQIGDDIYGETPDDRFGFAISLSSFDDRLTLAVGAPYNDGSGGDGAAAIADSGHVRMFTWDQSGSSWIQVGGDIDGEAEYDGTGYSVSLSEDGIRVAVGAPWNSYLGWGHAGVFGLNMAK